MESNYAAIIFKTRFVIGILHHHTATGRPVIVPLHIVETSKPAEYEKLAKAFGTKIGAWRSGTVYRIPNGAFEQFLFAAALLYRTKSKAEEIAETVKKVFDMKLAAKLNELGSILWLRRGKQRYGANDALEIRKVLARAVLELAEKYEIAETEREERDLEQLNLRL